MTPTTVVIFAQEIEKATDRWVFLESNSSGQYGWLEAQTGAPITDHIADLLTGGDCP